MTSLTTAVGGMKHWDWCPICRGGLDTGLECDQCGADLMPIYKALKESLSGGNPGEPKACTGAEERGISGATGAGQHPDGNPESTGDSADRRSPDGTARTPSPDESHRHPHEPGEGRKGPEVAEWPELPSKTNPDILVDERCMDLAKHFLAGGAEILGEPQDCVANRSSLARDIQQAVEDWFLEASLTKEIGHE